MSDITLTTSDGWQLAGSYYPVDGAKTGVVFLHMFPSTRSEWDELARRLQMDGIASIAIDQRGFGESVNKGRKETMPDSEFAKLPLDARAAFDYLEAQGVERIAVVGASIGANSALVFGSQEPSVRAVVALSPGLDYHGLSVEPALASFTRPLLLASSRDDEYSFTSSEQIFSKVTTAASDKQFLRYDRAGHGTRMFNPQPELANQIVEFLKERLSA